MDRKLTFADEAQRLTARDQDMEPGAGLKQRGYARARGHQLLEVIEQQQHVPVCQVARQSLERRPTRESPQLESLNKGGLE